MGQHVGFINSISDLRGNLLHRFVVEASGNSHEVGGEKVRSQEALQPQRTITELDPVSINPACLNYMTCRNVQFGCMIELQSVICGFYYSQYGASGFTNVWERHTNWENPTGFIQQRGMCPNSLWPHMQSDKHVFFLRFHQTCKRCMDSDCLRKI